MDESAAEEPISVPTKPDKSDQTRKKKRTSKNTDETDSVKSSETNEEKNERLVASETSNDQKSRSESPADEYNVVDYNTLIPAIAMDCGSDSESKSEPPSTQPIIIKKIVRNDKVCCITYFADYKHFSFKKTTIQRKYFNYFTCYNRLIRLTYWNLQKHSIIIAYEFLLECFTSQNELNKSGSTRIYKNV